MKKPLAAFRHQNRSTVAKLDGLKTIMRVTSPRKAEWYLVLPSTGDDDAVCVLLKKARTSKLNRNQETQLAEAALLKDYAARITA